MRSWRSPPDKLKTLPDDHLLEANRNLQALLTDTSIPSAVRHGLAQEFEEIERLADKLDREEVHIAVFGRVGTGKSSLCNALLGRQAFQTSALHGETRDTAAEHWHTATAGHVVLVDTPGIDELDGQGREQLATRVTRRADIMLFVCDGDLTELEFRALRALAERQLPLVLVMNKSDRYTPEECGLLMAQLRARCAKFLPPESVIAAAADPRPQTVIRTDERGEEQESIRTRHPDITALREHLWQILEKEGKSLAALNAAIFASEMDARVARRIVEMRKAIADKVIQKYCLGKGLAVAANPVPVADLLAAAGIDVAMVIHLGKIYGHQLSQREASKLLFTIAAQLAALMGAYWGVNLVSSALKGLSAGMTTALTGAAQGALAWYATYVIGRAAESWFARGKSWGVDGPRQTVRNILNSLDRDSLLLSARKEILALMDRPGNS